MAGDGGIGERGVIVDDDDAAIPSAPGGGNGGLPVERRHHDRLDAAGDEILDHLAFGRKLAAIERDLEIDVERLGGVGHPLLDLLPILGIARIDDAADHDALLRRCGGGGQSDSGGAQRGKRQADRQSELLHSFPPCASSCLRQARSSSCYRQRTAHFERVRR